MLNDYQRVIVKAVWDSNSNIRCLFDNDYELFKFFNARKRQIRILLRSL